MCSFVLTCGSEKKNRTEGEGGKAKNNQYGHNNLSWGKGRERNTRRRGKRKQANIVIAVPPKKKRRETFGGKGK